MRHAGLSLGLALGLALAATPWLNRVRRSWPSRVAVDGHSMEPTLRAGDWLLVDPLAYRDRPPLATEVIVARDPRRPARWLIKRVRAVLPDGGLMLAGDHPAHAEDEVGPLGLDGIVGRPWLRYWPLRRLGSVR